MNSRRALAILSLGVLLVAAGCRAGNLPFLASPTPTDTSTPLPSITPTASETPTLTPSPSPTPAPPNMPVSVQGVTLLFSGARLTQGNIYFTVQNGYRKAGTYTLRPDAGYVELIIYAQCTGNVRALFEGSYNGPDRLYIDNGAGGISQWVAWDSYGSSVKVAFAVYR